MAALGGGPNITEALATMLMGGSEEVRERMEMGAALVVVVDTRGVHVGIIMASLAGEEEDRTTMARISLMLQIIMIHTGMSY